MNFFQNIGSVLGLNAESEEVQKIRQHKLNVLNHLSYNELMKVAKEYISPNPKYIYTDHRGKENSRTPSRDELIEAINYRVPLDEIERLIPRAKEL